MRGWSSLAASLLAASALALPAHGAEPAAENVILMVSDGAGFNGWLAADYYAGKAGEQPYQVTRPDGTAPVLVGQTHWSLNLLDESGQIVDSQDPADAAGARAQGYDPDRRWQRFENAFRNDFPPVAIDYSSYTDSAAAGTALQTGRKTSNGRVNMDWQGEHAFTTIAQIADRQGRATGAVSSVMVSHATPATTWSHNVDRDNYEAIFNEMVESGLDVIMGAGHPAYDSSGNQVPESERDYKYVGGEATWRALTGEELNGYSFVESVAAFERLADGQDLPDSVLGIAQSGATLQAVREGLPTEADTPSGMAYVDNVPDLATMSEAALNVLDQNENGFYAMIEGGAPDWMAHGNNMPRFIEEQMDFNQAVGAVIDWVEANSSWDETLLIVTSDHETGGIWGAGTYRNGEGGPVAQNRSDEALAAANFDPAEDRFQDFYAVQNRGAGNIPGYQFASQNHTNEIVPLWALGAGAEMVHEFTTTDSRAAELWGDGTPYAFDGSILDNTDVFDVMNRVLVNDAMRSGM